MKYCPKCGIWKLEKLFSKNVNREDNLSYWCRDCSKQWWEIYYKNNIEEIRNHKKEYRKNNKEIIKKYNKNRYLLNKEKINKWSSDWKRNNKNQVSIYNGVYGQSLAGRLAQKKTRKKLYSTTKGKLNYAMRNMVRYSLKRNGLIKNNNRWTDLVGYTAEQLKLHLEKQFKKWMNWGNYGHGIGYWNVDHIKPIACFKFDSVDDREFKKCWSIKNLRPLEAIENYSKGAKIININKVV